ncbi:MAG: IPT/TIG domain-containing protein [Myxococcota bacterium]
MFLILAACERDAEPDPPRVPDDTATRDSGDSADVPPDPPTLAAIDPTLGDTLGGVTVTVTGTSLRDATALTIGGVDCVDLVVADTAVTCTTPALDAGAADVTVVTPGGSASLAGAYEAWSPVQIEGARVYTSAAGLTLDEPRGPLWTWEQTASEGPWHPRDGAGLVWFADKLWMLGGWYGTAVPEWGGQTTTNEVWSSDDLGATWVAELAHDAAPPTSGAGARWSARHTAGMLVHTHDGVPWIYVIGGDPWPVVADVWRSADGVTWEQVTADAEWGGRFLHVVGSYDGDLYVMGGQTDLYDPSTCLADVWRSEDGGVTWARLDDAPWAPRGMAYNAVEHDGRLWLIGGGTYDDAPRSFYNDVWAFDGATWTEVSPDGAAPWLDRQYHNTYAAEGELWVSSGYGSDGQNHNDFWHSPDGISWTEVADTPMAPGHADGIAVTPYGVVHASGNAMDTEVYRMIATEGAIASVWSDQGADALDLRAPAPESRPVVVGDAFDDEDGVWLDGASAYLQLDAWDPLPAGHSVFWVGRTEKQVAWWDNVNPSMTVVGDVNGACRVQAGYSEDQIELVVTDATGSWSEGHVLRGSGQTDGEARLVGFTHDVDGTVVAWVDGVREGDPATTSYDATWTGWDLVGAGFSTGSRAQVMLGLVVVVPAVVSDDDVAKLATFSRKWGTAAR